MTIVAIILSVIAIVLSILSMSGFGMLLNAKLAENTQTHIPAQVHSPAPTQYTDENQKAWEEGRDGVWNMICVLYYDMYTKCEIVDYEDQIKELADKMMALSETSDESKILIDKYGEYVRSQNGNDDY